MSDLIERLRNYRRTLYMTERKEAADRIAELEDEVERLQAENAELHADAMAFDDKLTHVARLRLDLELKNIRLQARVEELEYAIQMTHASIHCYDGYRGIGISEEAEALLNKALAATEGESDD